MTTRVFVRVPASSANLGAGFDCVAVAVNRWLSLTAWVDERAQTSTLERQGTLSNIDVRTDDDLIVRGFDLMCAAAGVERPSGLRLRASSEIPVARGLGSSAAGLVAGAMAADTLLALGRGVHDALTACSTYEGHADNVAAALFGGATLVLWPNRADAPHVTRLRVAQTLAFAIASPGFPTSTAHARSVLPPSLPYPTVIDAVARSAALVAGLLDGDAALLTAALDDVVHVPYRRSLVRGYDQVTAAARRVGAYGATLSGSGSSIVAVAPRAIASAVAEAMRTAWKEQGVDANAFVSAPTDTGASATLQVEPD